MSFSSQKSQNDKQSSTKLKWFPSTIYTFKKLFSIHIRLCILQVKGAIPDTSSNHIL